MDSFKISKEQYFDLMKLDRTNAVNLFLYLLVNADDNGALIVSIRKISSELDIGLRTVRTILKKLYETNIVTHQVTHNGSRVTINNIDCYKITKQAGDTPSDTPSGALETRKHTFGEKLIPYIEQYGKALIREFFDYWTEHNENGKNTKNPLEVQNLRLKIEKLIEKQSMVEVVEKKAKTLQQLKYLHTILAYFGLQTGNTLDEVKTCYFKRIVNRDLFVRQKHDDLLRTDREYVISTAKLTKEELSEAIERFRNWSSNVAGIYIPSSEEYIALLHIQHDIEQNRRYL